MLQSSHKKKNDNKLMPSLEIEIVEMASISSTVRRPSKKHRKSRKEYSDNDDLSSSDDEHDDHHNSKYSILLLSFNLYIALFQPVYCVVLTRISLVLTPIVA